MRSAASKRPRQAYLQQAEKVRELRRRFAALSAARQQRQRELALIRFEREELDQAALEPGELAEKARERERLAHAQNLQTFAEQAAAQLYDEEGSVVERLGRLHREAQTWAALDPGLEEVVRRLEETQSEVQDVTRTLRKLAQHWEADPEKLEEVEQRLQFLKRLETKYRRGVDDLIVYRVGLDEQETRLQKDEDDLGGIQTELAAEYAKLKTAAAELSKQRKKAAKRLAAATQKELADLGMAEARLDAVLEPLPMGDDPTTSEIHAWGAEQLELTLAANPGEPAWPLRKVASGGELSRTMLAIKTVLAGHDRIGTLVFDEIDANVGGRLGDVIGQKLAALGRTHQVVCVTHLPQVASYARWHWTIRKTRRGGRTLTQIQELQGGGASGGVGQHDARRLARRDHAPGSGRHAGGGARELVRVRKRWLTLCPRTQWLRGSSEAPRSMAASFTSRVSGDDSSAVVRGTSSCRSHFPVRAATPS